MKESSRTTAATVEREAHEDQDHCDVPQLRPLTIEEIKAVAGGPYIQNGA